MKKIWIVAAISVAAFFVAGAITLAPAYNNYSTDLYVDCTNGQDVQPLLSSVFGGACTSASSPCRDPQYAINQLNRNVSSQVTVHILGPTDGGVSTCYADNAVDAGAQATLEVDGFTVNLGSNPNAGLTIDCAVSETLAPITATGFTAGTSTSPPLLTVSTASWTPSAFKGQFVRVLSGTGAGKTYVIVDNSSTQLTIVTNDTLNTTTNFDIVTPAASISDAVSSAPTTRATSVATVQFGSDTAFNTKGSDVAGAFGNTSAINLSRCAVVAHGSGVAVRTNYIASVGVIYDNVSAASGTAIQSFVSQNMNIDNSYVQTASGSSAFGQFGTNATTQLNAFVGASGVALNQGGYYSSLYDYVASSSAMLNCGQASTANINLDWNNASAGYLVSGATAPGCTVYAGFEKQYGTPTAFASLNSGQQLYFASSVATTATNFISLDNGSTYVSKATIEAATNKTICTIGTGGTPLGCAKEQ